MALYSIESEQFLGYHNGYFEYDFDELMDYCEKNLGFSYEFKPEEYFDEDDLEYYKEDPESYEDEIEEAKNDAFSEWLDDYVNGLDDDEVRDFFYNHMDADLDLDHVDYTVEIPQAIINKAME